MMIPLGEGAILGGNVPDKPNTPMNCELDWSIQQRAHARGRRLMASIGRVYYRPRTGGDCTLGVKSDYLFIALLLVEMS